MSKIAVLIVAAGSGLRAGGDIPKQYVPLMGRSVLSYALETFIHHSQISDIICVIADGANDLYHDAVKNYTSDKVHTPVIGGTTRQDSVRLGLQALAKDTIDKVLIHDAARPFISVALIDRILQSLKTHDGVVPALPVVDSLRYITGDGMISDTLSRDNLVSVQTPQAFDFKKILFAHDNASIGHTDDVSVAREAGLNILTVKGCPHNVKLTYLEDFHNSEKYLSLSPDIRIGSGYDVHAFTTGDFVTLGGIKIACDKTLKGHSDADVLLHAITDAVLGACASEDIGHHFSPKNDLWKNANSEMFLCHALDILHQKGGKLNHIDATIICEMPKIDPVRSLIRENIARICNLPLYRVSIKATTTEKLGFTGRGEGIACEAVVTTIF